MTVLAHSLNRTIVIRAVRETVFRYFTDSGRWAQWWGAGSTIDPKPGGAVSIRYPDGTEVAGEVLEIASPRLIVFTYGYVSGKLIPSGGSRVTIRLDPHAEGTRLALTHEFADEAARDHHVQGWRYQLSLFSNVVADESNARAADAVDEWFAAWVIANERQRELALSKIAAPTVTFRDRFSAVDGIADLVPHIGGFQRFMPGMQLRRAGSVRHCQGTVLADWSAVAADGQPSGSGTNVFAFGPDARITSVVGFWS
jgi:uncharacterized protein YndB with AHSA1/START domain